MIKHFIVPVLILFLTTCQKLEEVACLTGKEYPVTWLISRAKSERIAGIVCNYMNENSLLGMQISIRDSLGGGWNLSLGYTDLGQNIPLGNRHALRIGSITKLYTATLMMELVEQGILRLEQPVADFLGDLPNVEKVSILHLLNHSSGIADVFSLPELLVSASNFPQKRWNPMDLAETCLHKKLLFQPGERHSYSNTNYLLLGIIAEKATGKRLAQLFSEHIIDPLLLASTRLVPFMPAPDDLVNGYVHHYALSIREWYTNTRENTAWSTIGYSAGAMVSSAGELSAFTHGLFEGDLLQPETLRKMTDFNGNMGLGLFRFRINDQEYWGHEGEITGFECITAYHPGTGVVISICCNTTPFSITDLLSEIDAVL